MDNYYKDVQLQKEEQNVIIGMMQYIYQKDLLDKSKIQIRR